MVAGDAGEIAHRACALDAIGEVVVIFLEHLRRRGLGVNLVLRPCVAVEVLDGRLAAIQREVASAISLMLSVEVHPAVVRPRVVEVHIHVVAGREAIFRRTPFRHKDVVREVLVGPLTDLSPEIEDLLLVLVVLHEAAGHIHAESVHALAVPEGEYVLEFLAHGLRSRLVHALLPRMVWIRVGVTVVEGWLAGVEILHIVFITGIFTLHPFADGALHVVRTFQHRLKVFLGLRVRKTVGPDVVVGVLEVAVLRALEEPRMLVGSVSGHKVEHHLYSFVVGFPDELDEVVIGPEAWVNTVEINHIVASVNPTGDEKRIEPDGRDTKALDVIQFGNHTLDVTDSVPVGVFVGGRVHLVDNSVAEPVRPYFPSLFETARRRLS